MNKVRKNTKGSTKDWLMLLLITGIIFLLAWVMSL